MFSIIKPYTPLKIIDVVQTITMGVADVVVKVDGFTNSSYLFSYAWI